VTEFPGVVAYAVPEPDEELRATMRALWAMYPECPPYGQQGSDLPPHATLTRYANPDNATFEQAKKRVEPLLPVLPAQAAQIQQCPVRSGYPI
jgi:hypothetical protein